MSKQVLDVQQMQRLQELGLELKETMMYWVRCVDNNPRAATHYGKWVLVKGDNAQTVGLIHWEFIPAYALQDVLDALPKEIEKDGKNYQLEIYRNPQIYFVSYCWIDNLLISFNSEILIDAAYELLVLAIENGYVETKKRMRYE